MVISISLKFIYKAFSHFACQTIKHIQNSNYNKPTSTTFDLMTHPQHRTSRGRHNDNIEDPHDCSGWWCWRCIRGAIRRVDVCSKCYSNDKIRHTLSLTEFKSKSLKLLMSTIGCRIRRDWLESLTTSLQGMRHHIL